MMYYRYSPQPPRHRMDSQTLRSHVLQLVSVTGRIHSSRKIKPISISTTLASVQTACIDRKELGGTLDIKLNEATEYSLPGRNIETRDFP